MLGDPAALGPLRVLFVDDSEFDVELAVGALRQAQLTVDWTRVDTAAGLESCLARGAWDAVVCDHNMPDFDSVSALSLLNAREADIPFLIVSGMIPDGVAIEAMRLGARDFLSKDQLNRLAPALRREVGEARNRHALRQAQASIDHLLHFDALTGVANGDSLLEHLDQRLACSPHQPFSLVLVDFNRFRKIMRGLGVVVGNRVLRAAAQRLVELLGPDDFIARLSGDRFALIFAGAADATGCHGAVNRIQEIFHRGFTVDQHELFFTCCMGVVPYPNHHGSSSQLIQWAEAALDVAKQAGPGQVRVYESHMGGRDQGRVVLETELYHALVNQEFVLYYQPQTSLTDGHLVGVEALLRWRHPSRGLVPPGEFIPILEETGLIVPVGEWVLTEACRQSVAWRRQGVGPFRVAVNLSALQFQQPGLAERVGEIILREGARPQDMELEITENVAMNNEEEVLATLMRLKAIGVALAIDDFGTGYSSLSYLQQFPVDRLKIDQSFVRGAAAGESMKLARAIVALGTSLGLETIAEGVETREQAERLEHFGCALAQGFWFARPMPPEAITAHWQERLAS